MSHLASKYRPFFSHSVDRRFFLISLFLLLQDYPLSYLTGASVCQIETCPNYLRRDFSVVVASTTLSLIIVFIILVFSCHSSNVIFSSTGHCLFFLLFYFLTFNFMKHCTSYSSTEIVI